MSPQIKIWHQSTTDIDACASYRDSLRRHYLETFEDQDVAVHLHGVPRDVWGDGAPSDFIASAATYTHLLSSIFFRNVLRAEKEGYDAFVIGSYTEPFLRECRSLVDIPVVSVTESSLLVACSFAKTFALVTLNEENVWFLKAAVERHGLSQRVSGIYHVRQTMTEKDIDNHFADPTGYAANFTAVAREGIENFADVIIPAEGLVAELVYRAGLRQIEGVPVMDGIGTPLQYAVMLARLRRTTGISAGRRWHYVKAPKRIRDELSIPPDENVTSAPRQRAANS